MTIRRHFDVCLTVSALAVLAAGSILSASATELPIAPVQRVAVAATPVKKPAVHPLIRIASSDLPTNMGEHVLSRSLILGVAY